MYLSQGALSNKWNLGTQSCYRRVWKETTQVELVLFRICRESGSFAPKMLFPKMLNFQQGLQTWRTLWKKKKCSKVSHADHRSSLESKLLIRIDKEGLCALCRLVTYLNLDSDLFNALCWHVCIGFSSSAYLPLISGPKLENEMLVDSLLAGTE